MLGSGEDGGVHGGWTAIEERGQTGDAMGLLRFCRRDGWRCAGCEGDLYSDSR